ncbi:MAG: porin, partial [Polyangiaceae bacterium]
MRIFASALIPSATALGTLLVASAAIAQSPEPPPTPGPKPVDPSPVAPAPPGPPNPTQPGPAGPPVDGPADPPPSPPDALDAPDAPDEMPAPLPPPVTGDAGAEVGPHGSETETALPPGHPPMRPDGLPPVPLAPPAIFPSQLQDLDAEEELVGIHGGQVFIRHPHDDFRFYPQLRLATDFNWSPGSPDMPKTQDGQFLHPSLFVRRVRLAVSGEILERVGFTAGVELGNGRIGETVYTGPGTSRFARAWAHDGRVRPGEATVSYRFREWMSFTAGMQNVPFSMSNRTRSHLTTFMERPVAIRGFAVPYERDLGVTVWGELFGERTLAYELGVFMGDGFDRPTVDARADYV